MKLILFAPIVLLAGLLAAADRQFSILFDYPQNETTNVVFRIHSTTNAVQPLADWTIAEMPFSPEATNSNGTVTLVSSNKVDAFLPATFFAVSASNEWGLAFSDVLRSAPARSTNLNLRLR